MSSSHSRSIQSHETLRAMRALPEYTRHIERELASSANSVNSLAEHIEVVAQAIHSNIINDDVSPSETGAHPEAIFTELVPLEVLEVAWNRLRRIRQMLVVSSEQRGTSLTTTTVSPNFYSSLVASFGDSSDSTAPGMPRRSQVEVLAASALSVGVAVALQDWEGLISVVAPLDLGHGNMLQLCDDKSTSSSSKVHIKLATAGLFGGLSGGVNSSPNASVSHSSFLIGTKKVINAAMSVPDDKRTEIINEANLSAVDRDFLLYSEAIAESLWAGDVTIIHVILGSSSVPSGISSFLLKLTQLAVASSIYKQAEASGMVARMTSTFKPTPSPSTPSMNQSQFVNIRDVSLRVTADLPSRFWGVPLKLEPLIRLY